MTTRRAKASATASASATATATAKTEADSYGMTTNRAKAKARAEVLMGYTGRSAALACGSDRVFCWDEFSICPVF